MHQQIEKPQVPVQFDEIANSYDFLTALNPGYKKHLQLSAERMNLRPDAEILDLCCGTGTSTVGLATTYPRANITALDGSPAMLAVAKKKATLGAVRWLQGDAMDPAAAGATGPYDGILMAYGIRNVVDPELCLRRLFLLLRPGGTVCFHEYSVADSKRAKAVWNVVANLVIVPTSLAVTRSPSLFRYLRRSVNEFAGVSAFETTLRDLGFVDVRTAPMRGWQRRILHSFLARRPSATS